MNHYSQSLLKLQSVTQGNRHGAITRLISPSDLGEHLKPFVFLDYFVSDAERRFDFPVHPHSGIATLSWQQGGGIDFWDSTGEDCRKGTRGTIAAGGLEWMNAGGGVWHKSSLTGDGQVRGFQLWVAMPPQVENAPPSSCYVAPEQVPVLRLAGGEVRLLLGELPEAVSPSGTESILKSTINSHQDMNYLVLRLEANQSWRYHLPPTHRVAWAFGFEGETMVNGHSAHHRLLAFHEGNGVMELVAGTTESWVVLGTAKKHDHPLILGRSSVHSSPEALRAGESRIAEIGKKIADAFVG